MFLFSLFTKEPKRTKQTVEKFIFVAMLTNVLVFCAGQVFAGNVVELKDAELDAVYAEGLSFQFDVSVAKPDTIGTNSPSSYDKLATGSGILSGNNIMFDTQGSGAAQIQIDPLSNNSPSQNSNPAVNPTGMILAENAKMNTVIVGDNSQQYLSSLVNVNAAGSFVPVLINIVINIGSQIDNLTNVNTVKLNDFFSY